MLFLALPLASALAADNFDERISALSQKIEELSVRQARCDSDFESCTKGVDMASAFAEHVTALQEMSTVHGACESSTPEEGQAFQASYTIPLVGDQHVSMSITDEETALVDFSGIHEASCSVPFSTTDAGVQASLDECELPPGISLKSLKYCADAQELQAVVDTPFAVLNLVAKADDSVTEAADKCVCGVKRTSAMIVTLGCVGPCTNETIGNSTAKPIVKRWCQATCSAPGKKGIKRIKSPGPYAKKVIAAKKSGCFDKQATTACRVTDATPSAAYNACFRGKAIAGAERVLMADLAASDLVLTSTEGELAITSVVANQHAASDETAPMLTLHTSGGAALSLTLDHAIFIDGKLAAAADAKVGSSLTNARGEATTIKRIVRSEAAAIINPVTASGTILASDKGTPFLAASHPMYIAPYVLASPAARAVVNAAIFVAGDVVDVATFAASLLAKIGATAALVALTKKVLRRRAASSI